MSPFMWWAVPLGLMLGMASFLHGDRRRARMDRDSAIEPAAQESAE